MHLASPAPRAERSSGPPATPRPAATVILLRGDADSLEVLLVRRNPAQRFMGGVWVFPGGAVDPGDGDGDGDGASSRAAVRELAEEAGVVLPGPQALVAVSRWITPPELAIRFDTAFYLAALPAGARARVDGRECVALTWRTPTDALAAHARGELELILPTLAHLERLAAFPAADSALAHEWEDARRPIQPRIVGEREEAEVPALGAPGRRAGGRD